MGEEKKGDGGASHCGQVPRMLGGGRAEESRRAIETGYRRIAPAQVGARVFVVQSRDGLHLR